MLLHSQHLVAVLDACLPLAAFAAAYWTFRLRGEAWREAVLGAATCWGAYVALTTELLSWRRWITRPALASAWIAAIAVSVGYALYLRRKGKSQDAAPSSLVGYGSRELWTGFDWILLTGIFLIVGLVGITAIIAPPNTWDAMAYHMSRVAQWMTNRDVRPYPAFYSPQLFLSPWAEYAILHFDVLTGSDRLANMVDWASMVGTIVAVSLISEELGAGIRGQILAAVACATMPAGILEASGAMNTYASSFWIAAAVYCALRWNRQQVWPVTLALGITVSLAILTKGTNYTFLPFLLLSCWWIGDSRARWTQLKRLPILVIILLIVNGPLYVRNYHLSGSPLGFSSPLGNDPERQYANSRISLPIAFANVVKNLALHIGTPVGSINRFSSRAVDSGLRHLHLDPNDKASTYRGGFHLSPISTYESLAGNPLQLAFIVLAIAMLSWKRWASIELRWLMVGVCASFVLFCALIRWQAWNGRYHLPLFAVGLAAAATIVERVRLKQIAGILASIFLLSALPFSLSNSLRPLAPWKQASIVRRPRAALYFADYHQTLQSSYAEAAQTVLHSSCTNIGIDASLDDFDYPMFAFLGAGHGNRSIRYTGVRNLTAGYARPETKAPCMVVCLRCAQSGAKWAQYRDVGGRATVIDEIAIFSAQGSVANKAIFVPPDPDELGVILEQIDTDRDKLRASPLGGIEERVRIAAKTWPEKQVELTGRIDSLYGETYAGWRVRDSAYPLRKEHAPPSAAAFDPIQVVAAAEVLRAWNDETPQRIQELSDYVDELNHQ